MILLFYFLFSIFFFFITWRRFEHGVFLFFLLLPTYLIRFPLFDIPTTLLEVMFWVLCFNWLLSGVIYHMSHTDQTIRGLLLRGTWCVKHIYTKQPILFTSVTLFLLGATVSIFTSVDIRTALGEWKAFYLEPIVLFLILTQYTLGKEKNTQRSITNYIIFPLLLCGLATSLLAVYQHFTGWMVPHAFWANRETYRVTAWYGFPNGVGLFLAPLVPLAIGQILSFFKKLQKNNTERLQDYKINNLSIFQSCIFVCSITFLITSLPAILFAKSTGAIIGIAVGIGFLLLVYKKTRLWTIGVGIIGIICLISIDNLDSIRRELTFQDRSGQIRLAIYDETLQLLKDHPLFGAGIASYEERIVPYHQKVNGESIEIFHHPHNIFLTIWVNTGLLGLIGFLGIIIWCFNIVIKDQTTKKLKNYSITTSPIRQSFNLSIFALTSFITLLVAGLVDSPYIKNDLAFLFWTIVALLCINTQSHRQDDVTRIQ
jgi:O-antigen ligase